MHTGIYDPIDTERDGKIVTHLSLPYSVDRSPIFRSKSRSAISVTAMVRGFC